ncbi:hypothetical protein F5Y10DRAFT_290494 [Nemania abortiva]|nr:hypothetical protein F5Y10DRAFT_290494 [Nemania abortiva]
MGRILIVSILSALAATTNPAHVSCISAVSWGDPRVDLFGVAPDNSIWHKLYTGYDWQPEKFERIPSQAGSCAAASSWDYGRLDLVWVNETDGNVLHKFFDGGNWGPSWGEAINLGGHLDLAQTHSWGKGRLDIVGIADNGSYMHKAWTGGNFSSAPNIGSWGQDRLGVHKYWGGKKWSDWEDLKGGPFIGDPTISSWGSERLDIWTLDKHGVLNHKFWDGSQWNGLEQLGGKFLQTPQVVHWSKGKIDVVGKNFDDQKFYIKSFDGFKWNPSAEGWYDLSGPYSSEPRLIAKARGQNFLYLFGIDTDGIARMQIWSGYEWQPSAQETWPLGNVSKPYLDKAYNGFIPEAQHVLPGPEL